MKNLIFTLALLISFIGFSQTPITNANFQVAINTCLSTNPDDGMCSGSEYGAMPDWDVSDVTNMRYAFRGVRNQFNPDISKWDVSNVVNMSGMFYLAKGFNSDISGWDVSAVTDMSEMFFLAGHFNVDISKWDVSSVTDMDSMFFNTGRFYQDLSKWNVINVKS